MTIEAMIEAGRGPVRPVYAPSDQDELILRMTFINAGIRATGSLLVALYQLFREETLDRRAGGTAEPGLSRYLSGREGSWESQGLPTLAWEIGSRIEPKRSRWDQGTVRLIKDVLTGWVTHPDHYVEVAENLASVFGRAVTQLDGWDNAADRPLRPGGNMTQNGTELVYNYLCPWGCRT
jgi:hypothetical protein